MSKAVKAQVASTTVRLRAELSQGKQVLQSLTNGLQQIEVGLIAVEEARAAEDKRKEETLKLQNKIDELQNSVLKSQDELQNSLLKSRDEHNKTVEDFDTAHRIMTERYNAHTQRRCDEFHVKIEEGRNRETTLEKSRKDILEREKDQMENLRKSEGAARRQLDNKVKILEETSRNEVKTLNEELRMARNTNKTLAEELEPYRANGKGHEAEISRLKHELADVHAYSADCPDKYAAMHIYQNENKTDETPYRIMSIMEGLDHRLGDVCDYWVGRAEVPQSWNTLPVGLRQKGLPRSYKMDTTAGQYVLATAIRHSACKVMVDSIFQSPETCDISDALHRSNPAHEAIWRLMTATTILGDQKLLETSKERLHEIANNLVKDCQLFKTEILREDMSNMLAELLCSALQDWLGLMKNQNKLFICLSGPDRHFQPDSGEVVVSLRGGPPTSDSTFTLCRFPAVFQTGLRGNAEQRSLLRQGTAMYPNSPLLREALQEERKRQDEHAPQSPRLNREKVFLITNSRKEA